MHRRDFLRFSLLGAAAACATPFTHPTSKATPAAKMSERVFGRTGVTLPILGLGGASLLRTDRREEALAVIRRALDLGVTYFDTSPTYGKSEDHYGEALAGGIRQKAFLATKSIKRVPDEAWEELENSLKRLRTGYVDLWQIHAVSRPPDLDLIFRKGGLLETFRKAREQKLARFIGITGHTDPAVLAECLRRFDWDAILMSLNAADAHHLPFKEELLPLALEKKTGIAVMKVFGDGALVKEGRLSTQEALGYVWTKGAHVAVIGADSVTDVEKGVAAAKKFTPFSEQKIKELEERTRSFASEASQRKAGSRPPAPPKRKDP